jgi:hypothetical protein
MPPGGIPASVCVEVAFCPAVRQWRWRPEGFDDGIVHDNNQTATVDVSFDGGATFTNVLHWDSDRHGNFYKPDATNETVTLNIANPMTASSMVLKFGLTHARNDWWWALDNLKVTGTTTGRKVSGKVTLGGPSQFNVPLTFEFRPLPNGTPFSRTVIPAADGTYTVDGIPVGNYNLWIKGYKWLSKVVPADVSTGDAANVDATLGTGDADDNNRVDIVDLGILANGFNSIANGIKYDVRVDFNDDGKVDITDLGLLADNFGKQGDP